MLLLIQSLFAALWVLRNQSVVFAERDSLCAMRSFAEFDGEDFKGAVTPLNRRHINKHLDGIN